MGNYQIFVNLEGDSVSFFDPQMNTREMKVNLDFFYGYLLGSLRQEGKVELVYTNDVKDL